MPSFVGNFNGQTDLVTVNAGSNDLTLISGFEGPDPVTSTIASGGVDPDAAFAFASGSGFEDLVVGNAGDGELALFEGGPDGLGLVSAATEPNLPDPTALAFSALTGGQVQFYAATAGRESAELVALSLGIETATDLAARRGRSQNTGGPAGAAARVVAAAGGDGADAHDRGVGKRAQPRPGGDGGTAVAAFLPGTGVSVGQGLSSQGQAARGETTMRNRTSREPDVAGAVPAVIAPWERFVIGLDKAMEKFRRENPNGVSGAPARDAASDRAESPPAAACPPRVGRRA